VQRRKYCRHYIMQLGQILRIFRDKGCNKVVAKILAANDNSKNQVYFSPDFSFLNIFPNLNIVPCDTGSHGAVLKAALPFWWVDASGAEFSAPAAQIILYPQYTEVRFSGFLKGCRGAPSALMTQRSAGRLLLLGICPDGRVFGHVSSARDELTAEFVSHTEYSSHGVFTDVPLPGQANDTRQALLHELKRITDLSWIDSKRLTSEGLSIEYRAPNGGGYTLEAELRIKPNGVSEPDFLGWEVKQHRVTSFRRFNIGVITLMTPEPTGGLYQSAGAEAFVRTYGYPDQSGIQDRLNFGGRHAYGIQQPLTGLELQLRGYDISSGIITSSTGSLVLCDAAGNEAASWSFAGLMRHWNRKHNKTVYVPSRTRLHDGIRQYWFGHIVCLGEGTEFPAFLRQVALGRIYYDPGIKVENASSPTPSIKKRSQFRIKTQELSTLYRTFGAVDVLNQDGN
jgi:hypothetical protein